MTRTEEYSNALNAYKNIDVHINKTLRLIGISAIEKQIPKKVLEDDLLDNLGRCQCCQKIVGIHQKYCWNCGQKLDWSEGDIK